VQDGKADEVGFVAGQGLFYQLRRLVDVIPVENFNLMVMGLEKCADIIDPYRYRPDIVVMGTFLQTVWIDQKYSHGYG
jgi:hypothetical protein